MPIEEGKEISLSAKQDGFPRWLSGKELVKNPPANTRATAYADWIPGSGHPLEEEMATHSSILAMTEHADRV